MNDAHYMQQMNEFAPETKLVCFECKGEAEGEISVEVQPGKWVESCNACHEKELESAENS